MLIDILNERGMTQAKLAQEMGVTRQAVNHWAYGLRVPQVQNMHRIAAVLGVPVEEVCIECILSSKRTPPGQQYGSGK